MKAIVFTLFVLNFFPALAMGGEKEAAYLHEKMMPLTQDFFRRIDLTNGLPLTTNSVQKYKVDYFDDRPGCMADLSLTNNRTISFLTEQEQTCVWAFRQHIRTYYALDDAPKEKLEAVKALNLKNKLNNQTALELARTYFKQLGHQENNFNPPAFHQSYWVGKGDVWGNLPYYEAIWYRKDVTNRATSGLSHSFPQVLVTVSGVDKSLIYYARFNLPINRDF
ncbi:MAG: hypothetical protein RL380_944 [Verrucomicrobiota bacterium]|jgi:hypothetical protein